jgi:hypothetical protein
MLEFGSYMALIKPRSLVGMQAVQLADGWCWFVLREEYWLLVAGLF